MADYTLICFDADGVERAGPNGLASESVFATAPVPSDIFLDIHGWKGDIAAAIDQYDRWFAAQDALSTDRDRLAAARPGGFAPIMIGLHWPSLPFGDEDLPAGPSFAAATTAALATVGEDDPLVEAYAARLGDRPGLRELLRVIVPAAQQPGAPAQMPEPIRAAYEQLDLLMTELPADGPIAPPGADNPPFDAPAIYDAARGPAVFGFDPWGLLLAPLQQLSFWKMKNRARRIGEGGFHALIGQLREHFPNARLHVMGHSFGCVAASAAIAGPPGAAGHEVASLALVQGALSLWSYGPHNPFGSGRGYFERLVSKGLVKGPIVTTRSVHDRALGFFYPLGAGAAGQIDFDVSLGPPVLPRFGAVGTFGAEGLSPSASNVRILPANGTYTLVPGAVHNVEASTAICKGGGVSGAHSDIAGPEVAHLIWSAAIAAG